MRKGMLVMLLCMLLWSPVKAQSSGFIMQFDNGEWIAKQATELFLISQKPICGYLYFQNQLLQEVSLDDWQFDDRQAVFSMTDLQPGWYSFYDENDQWLGHAVLWTEEVGPIADALFLAQKDNHYLLAEAATVTYVHERDRPNEGKTWEIEQKKIADLGMTFWQDCYFWIDQSAPEITYDIIADDHLLTLSDTSYLTAEKNAFVQVNRKDNLDAIFAPGDQWRQDGERWVTEIALVPGQNILLDVFTDLSGNCGHEPVEIFLDLESPRISLPDVSIIYLAEPAVVDFSDEFLDLERSVFTVDGEDIKSQIWQEGEAWRLKMEHSGIYNIELWDQCGHLTKRSCQVILDQIAPLVTYNQNAQRLVLKVEDDYLDPLSLQQIQLFYGAEACLLQIDEQQVSFEPQVDGEYHWLGEVQDFAGHKVAIDAWQQVDFQAPVIDVQGLEQTVFIRPMTIQIMVQDTFLKQWEALVYRNGELIDRCESVFSNGVTFNYDDQNYRDGHGEYLLLVRAVDQSNHLSTYQAEWVIDQSCAPIEMSVNGNAADQVDYLALTDPLHFQLTCQESPVNWQLFKQNQLLIQGVARDLIIDPLQQPTHLILQAEDQYGHTIQRTITFEQQDPLPSLVLLDGDIPIETSQWLMQGKILEGYSDVPVQTYLDGEPVGIPANNFAIRLTDQAEHQLKVVTTDGLVAREMVVQGTAGKVHLIYIGGGLLAFDIMRRLCHGYLRSRHRNTHLLAQDSTETLCLEKTKQSGDSSR